jgi:hypothetical protein
VGREATAGTGLRDLGVYTVTAIPGWGDTSPATDTFRALGLGGPTTGREPTVFLGCLSVAPGETGEGALAFFTTLARPVDTLSALVLAVTAVGSVPRGNDAVVAR